MTPTSRFFGMPNSMPLYISSLALRPYEAAVCATGLCEQVHGICGSDPVGLEVEMGISNACGLGGCVTSEGAPLSLSGVSSSLSLPAVPSLDTNDADSVEVFSRTLTIGEISRALTDLSNSLRRILCLIEERR